MLSSFKRYRRLAQGVLGRGFATHQQGLGGSHHRRRPPAPPEPAPTPPDKIEWWAVDGELFKAEKFDPSRVLAPLGNDHIPNRKRRKDRIKNLSQTRLKLKVHDQESYWAAYMKRFQAMRDEWERHVWDPVPIPVPKPRKSTWVAEESEKYVWKDPRRDAYTYDVSRMDHSASRSRFDNKIGYKVQGMNRYPIEGRRDPGGSSIRPGITPMRRDSYKDSRSYESAYKDERYGHKRSTDIGHRNPRQFEYDNFEDVFVDDTNTTRSDGNVTRSGGNATKNKSQSARHRQQDSMSTGDDEDSVEFSWDESDSEGDDGDVDDNDKDEDVSESRAQRDQSQSPRRRAWYGNEDDLFKDDDD